MKLFFQKKRFFLVTRTDGFLDTWEPVVMCVSAYGTAEWAIRLTGPAELWRQQMRLYVSRRTA